MITPTFTMAKLYEKQGGFTHALGVYQLLAKTDKQAKKKVKELTKKLYDNPNLNYNPLISLIFDEQQLRKIKLLPSEEYRKLTLDEGETNFTENLPAEINEDAEKDNFTQENNSEELELNFDDGISLADFKKMSQSETKPAKTTKMPEFTTPLAESQESVPKTFEDISAQTTRKSFDQMSVAQLLKTIGEKLDPQTKLTQITVEQLKELLNL